MSSSLPLTAALSFRNISNRQHGKWGRDKSKYGCFVQMWGLQTDRLSLQSAQLSTKLMVDKLSICIRVGIYVQCYEAVKIV